MNKCKFKPNQHVVAVVNGANVTQGSMYVVNTPYTNASDIPCVSVIGDNGNLAYNYQTVFREAKMPHCLEQDVVEEMSVEEATEMLDDYLQNHLNFGGGCEAFFNTDEFITKLQTDKELQKALFVLIGEGK